MDVAVLLLRVCLGLILMYYGSQKMFGLFGGPGPRAIVDIFQTKMGIPPPLAILAMSAEFFGGLGMVVGLLTSVAAFGVVCTMAVATFENWKTPGLFDHVLSGSPEDASKMFYSVVILVAALAVMLIGGGSFSLDAKFFLKSKVKR